MLFRSYSPSCQVVSPFCWDPPPLLIDNVSLLGNGVDGLHHCYLEVPLSLKSPIVVAPGDATCFLFVPPFAILPTLTSLFLSGSLSRPSVLQFPPYLSCPPATFPKVHLPFISRTCPSLSCRQYAFVVYNFLTFLFFGQVEYDPFPLPFLWVPPHFYLALPPSLTFDTSFPRRVRSYII